MPQRVVQPAREDVDPVGRGRDRAGARREPAAQRLPGQPRRAAPCSMPQRLVSTTDEDVKPPRRPRGDVRVGARDSAEADRVLVVEADEDAQVAAVVVGPECSVRVARVAVAGDVRRRLAAVVGDSVPGAVGVSGLTTVAGAEQHRDQSRVEKVARVADEVRRHVVLVMAAGVVHGQEVLVAYRHLPHHLRAGGLRPQLCDPREIAREVRERRVGRIPPMREELVVGALRLPPSRVMVVDVVEDHIPTPGGVEERRGLVRFAGGVDRRPRVAGDVHAAGPHRGVDRQHDIGRVQVAQLDQRLPESLDGVGKAGHVGEARRRDLGADGRGITARGSLLHVAPEIGLDVDDHRLAEGAGLLHQQFEVGVVRVHRRGVVQVAVVAV